MDFYSIPVNESSVVAVELKANNIIMQRSKDDYREDGENNQQIPWNVIFIHKLKIDITPEIVNNLD